MLPVGIFKFIPRNLRWTDLSTSAAIAGGLGGIIAIPLVISLVISLAFWAIGDPSHDKMWDGAASELVILATIVLFAPALILGLYSGAIGSGLINRQDRQVSSLHDILAGFGCGLAVTAIAAIILIVILSMVWG